MLACTGVVFIRFVFFSGVHCEGPFISREKKGAHKEMFVQDAVSQDKLMQCYGSLDNVSIVTLAPELPGACETIKWLSNQNIVVSLGEESISSCY